VGEGVLVIEGWVKGRRDQRDRGVEESEVVSTEGDSGGALVVEGSTSSDESQGKFAREEIALGHDDIMCLDL
jgi:hypothetical protein